jgi:hypothetical protein
MKIPVRKTVGLSGLAAAVMCALVGAAVAADMAKADAKGEDKTVAVARYTQDIIDAMDSDKNHEVSKQEFLDYMSKEFDRLDVNHDGKLTQSEILNKPIMGQQKSSVSHR